jgi:hypothetical protein
MKAVQCSEYGDPDNVVTIADFSAVEHGVRVTTGADKRAWDALAQAAQLYEAGQLTLPVAQTFPSSRSPKPTESATTATSAASWCSPRTGAHGPHCSIERPNQQRRPTHRLSALDFPV